ncbi:DNA replication protein DnaC [Clostridium tetanomorphum]|nr:ATP-binding protein [Clostridium tetanomorphum]KAJ50155.1 hypothetical protein CTM_18894 [Clostridium tetanomorphum DSM 665]KAJ50940.1 hypothetical protein CTM_15528 [Clostridium tetanomorphum DSM 665]MBP1864269.1 DNA replication protein DnaC [Clostridium tetanomorphum]NRS83716.1 DNA replication protein DnaC [Clostridium tetanomorphum]NRZ96907.1 DNA replication protein DnaC [Clostridium tetanomorphum]
MEKILETLKKQNNLSLELKCDDFKNIPKCEICNEPIGIVVEMPFGKRLYPRACKCRREIYNKQKTEDENKEKQERLNRVISNSMMNDNFKNCTFKNWNHAVGNEKLYKVAKQYVDNFSKMKRENQGMLIYGRPGNGKTYFASSIANQLLGKLIPVICIGAISLTERISQSKKTWGDEGIFTVLNALDNADLLIIDDLGTEEDNKWTRAMIYQIVEKRNNSRLPLIITTNMSINKIVERYDYRTYSRLKEMCFFIENTGKDIREFQGEKKAEKFIQQVFQY